MALVGLNLSSRPYEGGRSYGDIGAYEELRGRAEFALDPTLTVNQPLTDIDLAPKGPDGKVHFSADVVIARPADPAKRNRKLFFDVVNRGRPTVLRMFEGPDPAQPWVLRQGYTLVWCGWQHDLQPDGVALCVDAPEAILNGQSIAGKVLSVPVPQSDTKVMPLVDGDAAVYPAADLDEAAATLTDCDYPMGPGRLIPRDRWRFARLDDQGRVVPDAAHVYCEDGFTKGHSYEVVYTTPKTLVTGIGLLGVRDLVSFLRYAPGSDGNPLAGDIDTTLSFGSSQSGRFLRQLLYLGFNEDEQDRPVFDGIHAHIAGGRRIESNWRYGQPGYNGPYSMSGLFPYTDLDQTEPNSGVTDGLQRRASRSGRLPRVIYTNSSCEYWGNYAALIHTTIDGKSDAVVPDNVRIFHLAGTQHGGGSLPVYPERAGPRTLAYPNSTIDYRPLMCAALANLDSWVSQGMLPPASRHPSLGDGTLVDRESLRPAFARLPGPGLPEHLVPFAPLDFGANAAETSTATQLPPKLGPAYPALVAALDADYNEAGGLRHPDIEVAVASYTGWNPRHPDIGGEDTPLRLAGATMPFAVTAAEREASNDPRPAIEERYASREAFLQQVRLAAEKMVSERLLLGEGVDAIVANAGKRYDELIAAAKQPVA